MEIHPSPESIKRKTTVEYLNDLGQNMPKQDIREHIKQHREQRGGGQENAKIELNALAGFFTEKVWEQVDKWLKDNRVGMADELQYRAFSKLVAANKEKAYRDCQGAETCEEAIDQLAAKVYPIFYKLEEDYIESVKRKSGTAAEGDYDYQAYVGYGQLMKNPEKAIFLHRADYHQLSGFNVGTEMMLGMFATIPSLYYKKYHEPISQQKLEEIINASKGLILALANTEFETFGDIRSEIQPPSARGSSDSLENRKWNVDCLDLYNSGDKITVEIKPEVLLKIKKHKNLRTACPAFSAVGPSGKNVIAEIYDWLSDLAKKYYVPNIDKYNKSIIKKVKKPV